MDTKQKHTSSLLFRAGVIIWGIYLILDYLWFHPYYIESISDNPYWSIGLGYLVLSGATAATIRVLKIESVKGWMIYLWVFLTMLFLLGIYGNSIPIFKSSTGFHLAQATKNIVMWHGALLLLLLWFWTIGSQIIKPFSHIISVGSQAILKIAFGISGIVFIAVLCGLFGVLTMPVLIALALISIGLLHKSALEFVKHIFTKKIIFKSDFISLVTFFLLTFFVALNLVGMFKAYPKGYDGANLYLNFSHLLAADGGLALGGSASNWSVLMSLGEVVFGSPTLSIHISQAAGILAALALYRLGRLVLDQPYSLLATTLFYLMPMTAYHSRMDEKVDLGYLFIALALVLFGGEYWLNKKDLGDKIVIKSPVFTYDFLALASIGWLCGFAFGIKYTGMFLVLWLLSFLAYNKAGMKGFWASLILLSAPAYLITGSKFNFGEYTNWDIAWAMIAFIIIGFSLLFFAFKNKLSSAGLWLKYSLIIGLFFTLNYSPWLIKNIGERGLSFGAVIEGKKPQLLESSNEFLLANGIALKSESQFKKAIQKETGNTVQNIGYQVIKTLRTSKREEIQRYLGYEKGLPRYLSVFYDATMGANIQGRRYIDIGFLFLLFLPLIFVFKGKNSLWKNAFLYLTGFFILLCSVWGIEEFVVSDTLSESLLKPMSEALSPVFSFLANINFSISQILIVLTALGASYLLQNQFRHWNNSTKYLASAALAYGYLWWIMGAGILWYGFPALALACIFIAYFTKNTEEIALGQEASFLRIFFGTAIGIFFLLNYTASLTNYDNNKAINNRLFQDRGIEQFCNLPDSKTSYEKYDPVFQNVFEELNNNPEGKIYRVGTFFNYYIDHNDTRVFEDNQLGNFDIISKRLKSPQDFIKTLKINGFKYILFDLSTGAIDQTPEKSLKKKANAFEQLMTNNKVLKLSYTDNYMEAEMPNGEVKKGFGLGKATKRRGRFVLWEIL